MELLKKLQSLPEKTRKIILWSVVIILGICLLIWWFNNFKDNFAGFQGEEFIESLDLPAMEMPQLPEISEEDLNKLEQTLEENGQPNNQ